jgi:hypothetical protein
MNELTPAEEEPFEEIELGGAKRKIRFGFNTLCELEKETGINPLDKPQLMQLIGGKDSPVKIRLLLWAALWSEDPRPSLQQVGSWLSGVKSWDGVVKVLSRLQVRSSPEPGTAGKRGSRRPR